MFRKSLVLVAFLIKSLTASAATVDLTTGEARWFGGDLVRCNAGGVDPVPAPPVDPWRVINVSCECNCMGDVCNLDRVTEYANGETRSTTLRNGIYTDFRCEQLMDRTAQCHGG
jgi:hypothetical protein